MPTLSPPRPAPAGLPGTHGGRDRVSRTSGGGLRSRAGRLWPRGSHSRFIPCAGSASRGRCPWFQPLPPRLLPRPRRARGGSPPRSPDLGTGHGLGTRAGAAGDFGGASSPASSRRPRDGRVTGEHRPLKKHHFPNRESTFYFRLGVSNLDGPRIAWGSGRSAALDPGGLGQGRRRWVLNQLPATPTLLAGRPPASVQDLANKRKITRMTNQLWVCLPMCHILLPVRISC